MPRKGRRNLGATTIKIVVQGKTLPVSISVNALTPFSLRQAEYGARYPGPIVVGGECGWVRFDDTNPLTTATFEIIVEDFSAEGV